MANILPETDGGLITADNCAVVFIDHQPQMAFGVANHIDRQQLLNNVVMLARGAKAYGILRSFDTEAAAKAFYQSRRFQEWLDEIEPLVEGEPIRRQLTGLEAFFRTGGHGMPPKWKMAVVTWLGVVPSVLLWTTILPPALTRVHWLIEVLIVNACVVATLSWVVMPVLARGFDRWLHPTRRDPFDPSDKRNTR